MSEVKDERVSNSVKRQAYRDKQEEKRKTLKHVRIEADSIKESDVELPRVSRIQSR